MYCDVKCTQINVLVGDWGRWLWSTTMILPLLLLVVFDGRDVVYDEDGGLRRGLGKVFLNDLFGGAVWQSERAFIADETFIHSLIRSFIHSSTTSLYTNDEEIYDARRRGRTVNSNLAGDAPNKSQNHDNSRHTKCLISPIQAQGLTHWLTDWHPVTRKYSCTLYE